MLGNWVLGQCGCGMLGSYDLCTLIHFEWSTGSLTGIWGMNGVEQDVDESTQYSLLTGLGCCTEVRTECAIWSGLWMNDR